MRVPAAGTLWVVVAATLWWLCLPTAEETCKRQPGGLCRPAVWFRSVYCNSRTDRRHPVPSPALLCRLAVIRRRLSVLRRFLRCCCVPSQQNGGGFLRLLTLANVLLTPALPFLAKKPNPYPTSNACCQAALVYGVYGQRQTSRRFATFPPCGSSTVKISYGSVPNRRVLPATLPFATTPACLFPAATCPCCYCHTGR